MVVIVRVGARSSGACLTVARCFVRAVIGGACDLAAVPSCVARGLGPPTLCLCREPLVRMLVPKKIIGQRLDSILLYQNFI